MLNKGEGTNAIFNLYYSVGWMNYTDKLEMLKKAYENSLPILGV